MTKNSKDTDMNELISAMVGRSLDNRFPKVDNTPGEVVFKVEHLSTKYAPKLQDITFDVKRERFSDFTVWSVQDVQSFLRQYLVSVQEQRDVFTTIIS